jgi:hypothetical protein
LEASFEGKEEQTAEAEEILAALARQGLGPDSRRKEAVSRYLSAGEGWREASSVLGGAFARDETGLKPSKDG